MRAGAGRDAGADRPIVSAETFAPILLRADATTTSTRRSRCRTTCRRACPPRSSPTTCAKPRPSCQRRRVRLRHRQRQHRHLGRGNRRRLRRREGNRRRPRIRLGRVEGLHAPRDQHGQLFAQLAAGAGREVRCRSTAELRPAWPKPPAATLPGVESRARRRGGLAAFARVPVVPACGAPRASACRAELAHDAEHSALPRRHRSRADGLRCVRG